MSYQRIALVCCCVAVACGAPTASPASAHAGETVTASALCISLAHGTAAEEATRAQLERLMKTHDLGPWLLTRAIEIDESAVPHSHPVLVLHTRHLGYDDQLLSTFIHEQMHWHLDAHPDATKRAVDELRLRYPSLPVGFPDGASSDTSNYEHLPVIYLEYVGLARLVGPSRADATFRFWENDHYRALYHLLREHRDEVAAIVSKNGLLPPARR